MKTLTLLLLVLAQAFCLADEDGIIATGAWSAPVEGSHGNALRGRLLLCKSPKNNHIAYYLEIQDCANVWGNDTEVYCDLSPSGGCHLEARDAAGELLPTKPTAFSGGHPGASWITLHCDSTVRLRISAYAAFSPASTTDYFISGTFTVSPPANHAGLDVWKGKLELPRLKVTAEKR
jgi:hypothetical protein